jgi:hypothetical protein
MAAFVMVSDLASALPRSPSLWARRVFIGQMPGMCQNGTAVDALGVVLNAARHIGIIMLKLD